MSVAEKGMRHHGIRKDTVIGAPLAECGFNAFERDDGLRPDGHYDPDPPYNDYLRKR